MVEVTVTVADSVPVPVGVKVAFTVTWAFAMPVGPSSNAPEPFGRPLSTKSVVPFSP